MSIQRVIIFDLDQTSNQPIQLVTLKANELYLKANPKRYATPSQAKAIISEQFKKLGNEVNIPSVERYCNDCEAYNQAVLAGSTPKELPLTDSQKAAKKEVEKPQNKVEKTKTDEIQKEEIEEKTIEQKEKVTTKKQTKKPTKKTK